MIESVTFTAPDSTEIECKPTPMMYEAGRPIHCPFCGTMTMVTSVVSELPHKEYKGECPQCHTAITASV